MNVETNFTCFVSFRDFAGIVVELTWSVGLKALGYTERCISVETAASDGYALKLSHAWEAAFFSLSNSSA